MKKLILLASLAFLLSGCFPGLTGGSSGPATKPGDYLKGKAVKGFPSLPLYPQAKLAETYGTDGSFGANAYTEDEIEKVIMFYEDGLPKLGWESNKIQTGANQVTFEVNNNTQKGKVIVSLASDNETVSITLAVSPR